MTTVLKDVKEFTIVRSKWLRGGKSRSMLRDSEGMQCCLGFYAEACGASPEQTRLRKTPGHLLAMSGVEWESFLLSTNSLIGTSDAAYDLMKTNDQPGLSEAEREASVINQFAAHGVKVTFVD